MNVDFNDLTWWEKRLLDVAKDKAPREYNKTLRKAANLMRKNVRRLTKKKTGNLRRSYQVKKVNKDEMLVYTSAPHAHLVEYGHKIVVGGKLNKGGKVVGFVPGKYYFRKGKEQTEKELPGLLKDFVKTIGKELGMDVSE